jgi:hypothetical protein
VFFGGKPLVLLREFDLGFIGGELHYSDHCIHLVVTDFSRDLRKTQFELVLKNPTKPQFLTVFLNLRLIHRSY